MYSFVQGMSGIYLKPAQPPFLTGTICPEPLKQQLLVSCECLIVIFYETID